MSDNKEKTLNLDYSYIPQDLNENNKKWYYNIKWRETIGWAMDDFSSSMYMSVVISAIYSPYFVEKVGKPGISTTLWSVANSIPTIFSIIFTPIFGSIIDLKGHKLAWLGWTIVYIHYLLHYYILLNHIQKEMIYFFQCYY